MDQKRYENVSNRLIDLVLKIEAMRPGPQKDAELEKLKLMRARNKDVDRKMLRDRDRGVGDRDTRIRLEHYIAFVRPALKTS